MRDSRDKRCGRMPSLPLACREVSIIRTHGSSKGTCVEKIRVKQGSRINIQALRPSSRAEQMFKKPCTGNCLRRVYENLVEWHLSEAILFLCIRVSRGTHPGILEDPFVENEDPRKTFACNEWGKRQREETAGKALNQSGFLASPFLLKRSDESHSKGY
jgi:hypothetical protein